MNFFKKIDYQNTSSNIICKNQTYSYKDLFHDINHFKFIASKKSLVFILSENNYECIAAYSGVSYFDSVVMLLDGSIKQEPLNNLIKSYDTVFNLPSINLRACLYIIIICALLGIVGSFLTSIRQLYQREQV